MTTDKQVSETKDSGESPGKSDGNETLHSPEVLRRLENLERLHWEWIDGLARARAAGINPGLR